jgi:hypothetical protein
MTCLRFLSRDPREVICALPFLLQGTAAATLILGRSLDGSLGEALALAGVLAFVAACVTARTARKAMFLSPLV